MDTWRLIYLDRCNGYLQMALDESILLHRMSGKVPSTLRFYQFKPTAVSIGFFQSVYEEVNLDFCRSHAIDVVRRITGGGAVYHDTNGEITYSVIAGQDELHNDIIKSYAKICNGIVLALKHLGLSAIFKPINDVLVDGKKISGSAQTRKRGAILQHGTFMYNTDLSGLVQSLNVVPEKLKDKGLSKLEERVTTASISLGRPVSRELVLNALIAGFEEALNVKLESSKLTESELNLAEKLACEKYRTKEWTYME